MLISILVLFLNTFSASEQEADTSEIKIYLVKQRWHTGIVLEAAQIDTNIWKEVNHFRKFRHVDVGWGDEAFYQHPGFDAELAVKALFYPTPSTLRIEGFNMDIEEYAAISDIAVEIKVTPLQLKKLTGYINNTYFRKNNGTVILQKEMYDGSIKFYQAFGNYHLFNTCNTWIAEALTDAGFCLNDNLIFAQELFMEVNHIGKFLKVNGRQVNGEQ
jgi:uncharacterized protein (TIGR02117 family)